MQALAIGLTLFQAVGQIKAGADAKAAYESDAAFVLAKGKADSAQVKAAAANDALDRARKIRQAIGNTLVSAVSSGVSVGSGSVGNLVRDSEGQYARDIGLIDFNTKQTIKGITAGAQQDAATLKYQGQAAYERGIMGAAGTIGGFAMDTYNRGTVPQPKETWANGDAFR